MTAKEKYIQFISNPISASLPVFFQPWWLDTVATNWDVVISYNGDTIAGVWVYTLEQKGGVTLLRNPLLTPYSGPYVIFPNDIAVANKDSFELKIITDLFNQLPKCKVWFLVLPESHQQVAFYEREGFSVFAKQTFILQLQNKTSAPNLPYSESVKRNIKKGEQLFSIKNEPDQIALLYQYSRQTLKLKNKINHFSELQLKQLVESAIQQQSGALWVARNKHTQQVEGLLFNVWDKETSYYLMGAKNSQSNDFLSLTSLISHSIQEAQNRGNHNFDFEGSADEGVERFFMGFRGNRKIVLVLKKNNSRLWRWKEKIGKLLQG